MRMRVVILSPNPPDCVAFGPRQLASVLRQNGHECSVVFLRGSVSQNRFDGGFVYKYPDTLIDDIVAECKSADVVGVSFMSLYWDRAIQLTRAIQQRLAKPVIWGGTHPTLRAEQSIHIADRVCVGEGEVAFLEYLRRLERKESICDIPGIWVREGDQIYRNGEADEVADLNALPWPDMDTDGHFVDFHGRMVPMDTDRMKEVLPRLPTFDGRLQIGVRIMATRGCPHRCTYCASSAQNTLRRRTVESTIAHVNWLRERYPFLETVYEFDDTFFANTWDWLSDFATQWKRDVGLPWLCQTSPSTLTRKKLELLIDSGLVWCEMGIQSGSDEVKTLFKRHESEAQVRRAAMLLHDFAAEGKLLPPRYHIITDNPWESPSSVLTTIALLLELPRPFTLAIGSLCLFPGTALNDRAWAEGLLDDEVAQVYRKPFLVPRPNLLNWLIEASAVQAVPKNLLRQVARFASDRPQLAIREHAAIAALARTTRIADRIPRALAAIADLDSDRIRRRFSEAP
jgi:anaerobic magnesium-protoporphyrin IX monomethyl ester cyclase